MAKASNKMVMFFNLVLLLSLLLILSMAEARLFGGSGKKLDVAPECDAVFAVRSGDTCFEVKQLFNLTADEFSTINPNLNCESLFVGQWLCVDGTAN